MQSPRLVKEMDNMMKLIIAIVQDEDASHLISELMNEGFSVTKLPTLTLGQR